MHLRPILYVIGLLLGIIAGAMLKIGRAHV